MGEPIRVDFQAGGIQNVQEAFRTVTEAASAMQRKVLSSAKSFERFEKAIAAAIEKSNVDAFKNITDASAKMRKQVSAATKRWADYEKAAASAVTRTHEMASAQQTLIEQREGLKQLQQVQRFYMARRRTVEDSTKHITEQARLQSDAVVDAHRRATERIGRLPGSSTVTSGAAGAIKGGIMKGFGTVANAATMTLGVLGGFSVADSVQKGLEDRGKAADLANQAGNKVSSNDLRSRASSVATQYGMSTGDVLSGLDAFVAKSGDVLAGLKGLSALTELATATGADMRELLQTAGIVHMGTGDMSKTLMQMRVLAGAGREGSVDMRELAQYAGRISSGAAQFENKGSAFSQLSAIVQQAAATGGATAAPEATEAVVRLATDIINKRDKFEALGIKTMDKTGKFLRDPKEIIKETIARTKGDPSLLLEMFGHMSYRAVAGYQDVYNRAGGGAAGMKAVDEAFNKFENAALSETTVREDAAKRMQEIDKRLASTMNELRERIASELIPVIIDMVPTIKELIPQFAKMLKAVAGFVDWVIKNPLSGVATMIGASVAKELAAVAIGNVVTKGIERMLIGTATADAAVATATGVMSRGMVPAITATLPMLANPIGLAIAGVVAAALGVKVVSDIKDDKAKKDLTERPKVVSEMVDRLEKNESPTGEKYKSPTKKLAAAQSALKLVRSMVDSEQERANEAGSWIRDVLSSANPDSSYPAEKAAEIKSHNEAAAALLVFADRLESIIKNTKKDVDSDDDPFGNNTPLLVQPPVNASIPMTAGLRAAP